MRVAVIGAGMTGLVAALRLGQSGHRCDVYERWPGLGGQVATLDVGGDPLERYYHHLFTTDVEITRLYEELGMGDDLEWRPSSVAVFANGRSHPFTTPLDLLRFRPLGFAARLRMGFAVLMLQRRHPEVGPFEDMTAKEWILRAMGRQPWEQVWGPLLRGKFGSRAEDISMAWLWSKLTLRRRIEGASARQELLGYPRGSWQPLLERLQVEIEAAGGRVLIDRPAASISRVVEGGYSITAGTPDSFRRGHDPRRFEPLPDPETYDGVVATVPGELFLALLDEELRDALDGDYADRVESIEYHEALCLLLELDRPFSDFYWTNIADPQLPFVGLIEQTNFVEPARYGGTRFLYVANYLERGHPWLPLSPEEIFHLYEPGLRKVQPAFDQSWVKQSWLFREPAAQPIVTRGYRERMPALTTGVPGLVLANTTQIYPEDRGTNYSVRLGGQAAEALLACVDARGPRKEGDT